MSEREKELYDKVVKVLEDMELDKIFGDPLCIEFHFPFGNLELYKDTFSGKEIK